MDFFARQDRSRRTSRYLVVLFMLAFLAVALATTVIVAVAVRLYMENNTLILGAERWDAWVERNLMLLFGVAAGTIAAMAIASLSRAATLARGGGQVARMLGGVRVTGEDSDLLRRRLINVVEEIAIASGLPVPEVYVLEEEPGINAFAAGLSEGDAAIAVTRGALERLDRAELQGVIAHEFSHILNGDMRLNQQLIGMSFGILVLALAGRWMLRSARYGRRGRNSGGAGAALLLGLALTVIGGIGVLLSRLIKAGVSRQRESLADASAVQFTREPTGLAGALKKIAGYTGRFSSVDTEEVAHMLFEHKARAFSGWFSTHPPLVERIRALDPTFDPRDLPPSSATPPKPAVASVAEEAAALAHAAAPATAALGATAAEAASAAASGQRILERAGEIEAPEVGGALRAAMPEELYHAAHSHESSFFLVLALALSSEPAVSARQLTLLESQLGAERANRCRTLARDLRALPRALWLPLLELAVPALKLRPKIELEYLFELIRKLAAADDEQQLFEYVLLRVLAAYLASVPDMPAASLQLGRSPAKISTGAALAALLANVAAFGHEAPADAVAAYRAGIERIGGRTGVAEPAFEPLDAARDLARLDAALVELARLKPQSKRRVLDAVFATIQHDRRTTVAEIELFRAVAATLGCPLPPSAPPLDPAGGTIQIR